MLLPVVDGRGREGEGRCVCVFGRKCTVGLWVFYRRTAGPNAGPGNTFTVLHV